MPSPTPASPPPETSLAAKPQPRSRLLQCRNGGANDVAAVERVAAKTPGPLTSDHHLEGAFFDVMIAFCEKGVRDIGLAVRKTGARDAQISGTGYR